MLRFIFDETAGLPDAGASSSSASSVTVNTPAVRRWIAQIAYDIWEKRGRRRGEELWNWLSAEKFVVAQLVVLEGASRYPATRARSIRPTYLTF